MLSAVQSSNVRFATTPARMDQRRLENRLTQADAWYNQQRVDQAFHREFRRNTSGATADQERARDQKATAPQGASDCRVDPRCDFDTGPDAETSPAAGAPVDVPEVADVAGEVWHVPYRACAGAAQAMNRLSSWLGKVQGPQLFAQAAPSDAAALPVASPQVNILTLNSTRAHDFLAAFVGGDDGTFMADAIGMHTIGKELMLAPVAQSRIEKRAAITELMARDNAIYQEYLRNNCHVRTKTVAGHPIGDGLLVAGEYARNPWRGMAELLNHWLTPDRQLSENEEFATEVFNVGSDIGLAFITSGLYPIVKYGIAKSMSIGGQAVNGDATCLKREFSPEELARLLFDTEIGVTHHQPFPLLTRPAGSVAGAGNFKPSGLFVEQHLPSGIHTEKYMAIRKDGATILIREKAPGEFVTHDPLVPHPETPERPVFFDPKSQRVYFDKDFSQGQGYDFSIVDGRKFIEVHGEQFELHVNREKQQLEVRVEQGATSTRLPVYKEKLSHTWHLGILQGHPVFADWQKALINKMKVTLDDAHVTTQIDNLNPDSYGSGKLYEVRRGDVAPSAPPDLHVIEMNGELIPVRMEIIEGHGVRLDAYNAAAPDHHGRPVAWDGQRWMFEKQTSNHVALVLKKMIDASMLDHKITVRELSAPDQRGVQWDRFNRGFLKIRGGYVRIRQRGNDPDAWYFAHQGTRTSLHFRDNRFYPENFRHRIKRINEIGLSGRRTSQEPGQLGRARERTAEQIIADCFGSTPEEAAAYLQQFHFEPNSLHNARELALYLESYDALPHWAEHLRTAAAPAAPDPVPAPPAASRIQLGRLVGRGGEGAVYLDATDNNYVIKRLEDFYFSPDPEGNLFDVHISESIRQSLAGRDVMLFNRYYGEGMAEVMTEAGDVYIRMPRVPGVPLHEVARGQMPDDGVERYVDMLERLTDVGIWHGDLHAGNIMFDPVDNIFYPIDFSNIRELYLAAGQRERAGLNFVGESQWFFTLAAIRARMNRPGPSGP